VSKIKKDSIKKMLKGEPINGDYDNDLQDRRDTSLDNIQTGKTSVD